MPMNRAEGPSALTTSVKQCIVMRCCPKCALPLQAY
jgi:hypothetical protein